MRFADDFVIFFARKEDAERFYKGIFPRFEKFGLILHPETTMLVPFKRPSRGGPNESESWDFLGFSHDWTKSRKGHCVNFRKSMASRLSRGLNAIGGWCRAHRHLSVKVQHQILSWKLNGHCAFHGITGNSVALVKSWRGMRGRWLRRRSNAAYAKNWDWWARFHERYPLPPARAIHSSFRRTQRTHESEEPDAPIAHVWIYGSPGEAMTRRHAQGGP